MLEPTKPSGVIDTITFFLCFYIFINYYFSYDLTLYINYHRNYIKVKKSVQ